MTGSSVPRRTTLVMMAAVLVLGVLSPKGLLAAEPLKVGTIPGPVGQIVQFAAEHAKKNGLDVKVVEFSDWITPNEAVQSGALDVNVFQHIPFLKAAAEARGYRFKPVAATFVIPSGLYSKKIKNFSELKEGATVAVANDPVNEARGLLLFEKAGLIKLRQAADDRASLTDIIDNPKRLKFLEIEAPQLPRILDDVDLAQVSIGYLIASGGKPEDLLIGDGFGDSRYALQIVAREDKQSDPRIQRFAELFRSPDVKEFIQSRYGAFLIPVW